MSGSALVSLATRRHGFDDPPSIAGSTCAKNSTSSSKSGSGSSGSTSGQSSGAASLSVGPVVVVALVGVLSALVLAA